MRLQADIEALREEAYRRQGWDEEQRQPRLGSLTDEEQRARAFAEGVEAGLLFALGDAASPWQERPVVEPASWWKLAHQGEQL